MCIEIKTEIRFNSKFQEPSKFVFRNQYTSNLGGAYFNCLVKQFCVDSHRGGRTTQYKYGISGVKVPIRLLTLKEYMSLHCDLFTRNKRFNETTTAFIIRSIFRKKSFLCELNYFDFYKYNLKHYLFKPIITSIIYKIAVILS